MTALAEEATESLTRLPAQSSPILQMPEARQHLVAEGCGSSRNLDKATSSRADTISVAVIDEYSFTRQSITRSLERICEFLNVSAFSSSDECLDVGTSYDVILYHAHETGVKHEDWAASLACIKTVLPIAPVIVLCDIDSVELIRAAFASGARGYIPTESTTLEVAIEVVYLVKAGGTFVPPSSLSSQRGKSPDTVAQSPARRFTPRQIEVLDRLKLGQTNKSIAYGLKMSESSVKTHIQNIMRKLGATNRTEVACLAQRLEMTVMRAAD